MFTKSIEVSGASTYTRGAGRNKKTFAQVTFLSGEGSARRSRTAHPEFRPRDGYIGLNPDSRAVPLNALYERELREAESGLDVATSALTQLEDQLEKSQETEAASVPQAMIIITVELEIGLMIEAAKTKVEAARKVVYDAEKKLNIVQRELPLEVEFVGPGLTY